MFVPKKAKELFEQGNRFLRKKRYEKAILYYDAAIKKYSKFAQAWYNKGVVLGMISNFDQALECFNKAINLKPNYVTAWINKGAVLGELGKLEKQ